MPQLTEEFIESLKENLKEHPIEAERPCDAVSDGSKEDRQKLWRNWQCLFDRYCMSWSKPHELALYLEVAVRNCEKAFSEFPVVIKGTPSQQMGIMALIWYEKPNVLVRLYKLLHSRVRESPNADRHEGIMDLMCTNREQVLKTMDYFGKSHLKTRALDEVKVILDDARKYMAPRFHIILNQWHFYAPSNVTEATLQQRVEDFIFDISFAYKRGGPLEICLPESEPDLDAFLAEMWKQSPKSVFEYSMALRITSGGENLLRWEKLGDVEEELCNSCDRVHEFLRSLDKSMLPKSKRIKLEAYLALISAPPDEFRVSKSYNAAVWVRNGTEEQFSFNEEQATIIGMLLVAYQNGTLDVKQEDMIKKVCPNNFTKQFHDLWRKGKRNASRKKEYVQHPAWNYLIIQHEPRSGTRRLALSSDTKIEICDQLNPQLNPQA